MNVVCTDGHDSGDPGICALATDGTTLFCAEARGRHGGGSDAPSTEDISACSGKTINMPCTDTVDGGDPGTCALAIDGTTVFCAETHAGGGAGACVPSAEDIASCTGKAVAAACTDVVDGRDPGTCQLAPDGITLACRETLRAGDH